MNYRLQLSPISGARDSQIDLPPRKRPESSATKWEDAEFFRSWLVYDSDLDSASTKGRVNGPMVLGLALAVLVSVTFWIGLGLMIASRWK
jgi:hypothetical protein